MPFNERGATATQFVTDASALFAVAMSSRHAKYPPTDDGEPSLSIVELGGRLLLVLALASQTPWTRRDVSSLADRQPLALVRTSTARERRLGGNGTPGSNLGDASLADGWLGLRPANFSRSQPAALMRQTRRLGRHAAFVGTIADRWDAPPVTVVGVLIHAASLALTIVAALGLSPDAWRRRLHGHRAVVQGLEHRHERDLAHCRSGTLQRGDGRGLRGGEALSRI